MLTTINPSAVDYIITFCTLDERINFLSTCRLMRKLMRMHEVGKRKTKIPRLQFYSVVSNSHIPSWSPMLRDGYVRINTLSSRIPLDSKGRRNKLMIRGSTILTPPVLRSMIKEHVGIEGTEVEVVILSSGNQARTLPAGSNKVKSGTVGYTDYSEVNDEELQINKMYLEAIDLLGG